MGYFFEHSCQKPEPSPIPQSSILGLRLALVRINTSVPGSEKTKQSRLIFQSETMLSRLKFATPSFGHCVALIGLWRDFGMSEVSKINVEVGVATHQYKWRPSERLWVVGVFCVLSGACGVNKFDTPLDLCVSSLRKGHANLLCIVPNLTDDPRRES